MRFIDLLYMSSSSLWKRKIRTVLTVLGVVIGTASIVVMISLGLGLNKSSMRDIENNGGLTAITVQEKDSMEKDNKKRQRMDDELIESIRKIPHVDHVSGVLTVSVIAKSGIYENNMQIRGMSEEALESMKIPLEEGRLPKEGEGLEILYGNQILAGFQNPKTGSGYWSTGELPDIDLMKDPVFLIYDTDNYYTTQNTGGNRLENTSSEKAARPKKYLAVPCGLVAGGVDNYNSYSWNAYCNLDSLKTFLKREFRNRAIPGQPTTASGKPYKKMYYNELYVNVDDMENVAEVQKTITDLGCQTYSNSEWVDSMKKQYGYIQAVLGGIGAVSLFVAAIGITNTMMMSIYERTREIGVMKVLGCDMKDIRTLFLMEAGFIGFIGGIAGLLLSFIISFIINKVVISMGMEMTLSYIPAWLAGASVAFAVFVGMAAGFFPSLRAMKLSPLAAIRNE